MSFLSNLVTTLAKPVNATVGAAIGVNAIPDVKPDEVLVYTDCIAGANLSVNHISLGVGEYNESSLGTLGLTNKIVGIRPGKNVQVTVYNPPNVPFVVGANIGDQCLPEIWRNQVKSLKIEKVESVAPKKEGFGGDMLFTLINVLLVLLILFIVYKLVA